MLGFLADGGWRAGLVMDAILLCRESVRLRSGTSCVFAQETVHDVLLSHPIRLQNVTGVSRGEGSSVLLNGKGRVDESTGRWNSSGESLPSLPESYTAVGVPHLWSGLA